MENAFESLRLLLTRKIDRAADLAKKLSQTNTLRQEKTTENLDHAKKEASRDKDNKIIVISHDSYAPGVIGLVANRLVNEFYKPSVVIAQNQQLSKGSARSVSGLNITEAISSAGELLTSFGGHPMAAGFSMESAQIPYLREKLIKYADENLTSEDLIPTLKIDSRLDLENLDQETLSLIRQFEPFGIGNPEPMFTTPDLEVSDVRTVGSDGSHIKMVLRNSEYKTMNAIGFGLAGNDIKRGQNVDVAYNMVENVWNGNRNLELRVKDIKPKK